MKVPVGGGEATTIASGQDSPTQIVVDSTNVYWVTGSACMSTPVSGGPVTAAVTMPNGYNFGIATDGTSLYWAGQAISGPDPAGVIVRLPPGGSASTLASAQFQPRDVLVDSARVYWADLNNYGVTSVMSTALVGGTVATLVPAGSPGPVYPLAIVGATLYGVGDSVTSVPLAGGTVTTLAANQLSETIAVDADNVYWVSDSVIKCVPLTGGRVVTLAPAPDGPGNQSAMIAVDATSVYWVDQGRATGVVADDNYGYVAKVSKR
jgi:hypothetical protein